MLPLVQTFALLASRRLRPGTEREVILLDGFEGASVLVAHDDRVVRRIVAKLHGLGYEVTNAEDGCEALDLLKDGEISDLPMTDSEDLHE